ncbi:MAG TPA: response regulator [Thermoanaerobaculaceae bacterium]|nr:response regulator [Thermoanaerobaculaceae bacterium]
MSTDRVLLVDDEVEFVETLAERLRIRGLEVEVAHTGPDGVAKAEAARFDAVVLDFAMPGMDGIATLKALLAVNPDLQAMLLTGHATIKTAAEATRLGAVDVLEKPTDIDTLLEKIREARARRLALTDDRARKQVEVVLKTRGW